MSSRPVVAIVGRPNVGKSRLFNRYAGHRRALVENRPGITRDRIAEEIEIEGRRILLVDTAGLEPPARPERGRGEEAEEAGLSNAVQEQARAAVAEADAILFVLDGRAGLLPEDEAIARTLRRTDKPLLVAVNKIDAPEMMDEMVEFHRLGLEPIHAISAEHGMGAFGALEALVASLPPAPEAAEAEVPGETRIAIVGRPNVGKSSLTNRLLGEERVVVSAVPGTTRDSVDARIEREEGALVLVDTAGLRRPGRRVRTAERGSALMTVRSLERAQVALLVVDAAEGLTDQDAHVGAMICDLGRATVVVANKWDLVAKEDRKAVIEGIEHGLRFMPDPEIVPVSAKTGARTGRVLAAAAHAARAALGRIPTADLNRWLQQVTAMHTPPASRRGRSTRPIKFFYATQTGEAPPAFVLFCSDPKAVGTSYRRYLENRLREAFDFRGTPVRLHLRARAEHEGD